MTTLWSIDGVRGDTLLGDSTLSPVRGARKYGELEKRGDQAIESPHGYHAGFSNLANLGSLVNSDSGRSGSRAAHEWAAGLGDGHNYRDVARSSQRSRQRYCNQILSKEINVINYAGGNDRGRPYGHANLGRQLAP